MTQPVPTTMKAAAINQFGDVEELKYQSVPVPQAGDGEVLVRMESVGVGIWDPMEAKGYFAAMTKQFTGAEPKFPYVVGFDGAGTVAALGRGVDRFKVGDRVWGVAFLNPKGGCYAEYCATKADYVSAAGRTDDRAGRRPRRRGYDRAARPR